MDPQLENLNAEQMNALISGRSVPSTPAPGGDTNPGAAAAAGNGSPAPAVVPPNTDPAVPGATTVDPTKPGDPAAGATNTTPEPFDFTKWHNGRFKSITDVDAVITQVDQLPVIQKQLNEALGKIPNYSERVQKAIEFASRYEGMEDEAAARYLELQRTDVKKLSDQQLRFTAFKLDPKYAKLPEERQRNLFNGMEAAQYGDPNNATTPQTDYQKELQALATDEARETITKLQGEYQAAKGAQLTPEEMAHDMERHRGLVQQQLSNFAGIPMKFSASTAKGEKVEGALNFKIEPEQLKTLVDAVADPLGQWDKLLETRGVFTADPDQPDRAKFAEVFSRLIFQEQIDNQIYKQGLDDMLAFLLKTHRNPKDIPGGGGGLPSGGQPKAPDIEQVAAAFAKQQGLM